MADEVDRANDDAAWLLYAAIQAHRTRPSSEALVRGGVCLWCQAAVEKKRRWCNAACRDEWERNKQ